MRSLPSEILQMPADRVGPALLELAEDQWFDRKSARVKPTDLANAQIAFANAEGGTIVVGLRQGQVEGIDGAGIRHENGLRQAAIDFSDPMVRAHVSEVPCTNSEGDSDRLLIFEVEPSWVVHTNRKDEVFLRVGDESRRLTFTQRQELTYDKGQSVFDGSPVPGATSEDLDWELVYDVAERVGSADPARLLARRGLLRGDEVSAAALLLFGGAPQRDFPNAFIRVLRYRGTVKGSGSQQQLLTDTRFDGTLEESLQQAVNTVSGDPADRASARHGRAVSRPPAHTRRGMARSHRQRCDPPLVLPRRRPHTYRRVR